MELRISAQKTYVEVGDLRRGRKQMVVATTAKPEHYKLVEHFQLEKNDKLEECVALAWTCYCDWIQKLQKQGVGRCGKPHLQVRT